MATKDTLISICEREFILNLVGEHKRLDGRDHLAARTLSVLFGTDAGCCMAVLGNTRVLAQVSCEVTVPKLARPTEGLFQVNVEISPMADIRFEVGRSSDLGVETSRLIERCLRESKCLDLESLCIVAKEKVWSICVDVKVMIHDGNIVECASVAAVTALSHFRRPHVSVIGTDVTVYPFEDHSPVPLAIHHLPFCISFAVFEQGKHILVDPTELEEQVADGKIVIAMNSLREICTEHMSGTLLLKKEKILQCTNIAESRAQEITKHVKKVLEEDSKKRAKNEIEGFSKLLHSDTILSILRQPPAINLMQFQLGMNNALLPKLENTVKQDNDISLFFKAPGIASLGEGKANSWGILHCKDDFEEDDDEGIVPLSSVPQIKQRDGNFDEIKISDESEEEAAVEKSSTLEVEDSSDDEVDLTKAIKGSLSRDWYPKSAFL